MEVEMLTVGSFAVNCYLLYEQKSREAVFIDPGAEAGRLIQRAGELNLQVKSIVNTHGHIDHAAEAALVQQHFDIPFFIHAEEEPLINSLPEQGSLFGISVKGKPKINRYLSANDEIKIGDVSGWVIHTPGHSPGGISLVFDKKVFVGDCLFMDSIGRTDLYQGNYEQLLYTIETKLLTLPDDTVVFPGHGPNTSIGREKKFNPFLQNL